MTSKKGFPWNLTLNLSVGETTVVVPEGLVVVGMSKVLEEPAQESDGVHLTFSGGKVILSYKVMAHRYTEETPPGAGTHQPTITSKAVNSSPSTVETAESIGARGSEEGKWSVWDKFKIIIPAVVGLSAAAIGGIILARRRSPSRGKRGLSRVSDPPRLKRRGGEAKQSDLMKVVAAPRTTVWRRIRRFERDGFVELKREGDAMIELSLRLPSS